MNAIDTTIGYARWSHNPASGCLNGCSFCYAAAIANRFGRKAEPDPARFRDGVYVAQPGEVFPVGFQPTFYPHRMTVLKAHHTPSLVFVGDMADLWGGAFPSWVQDEVVASMSAAPQHQYLCLTKGQQSTHTLYYPFELPRHVWPGVTVTCEADLWRVEELAARLSIWGCNWVSCEPLMGPVAGGWIEQVDWIVIGPRTGAGKRRESLADLRRWTRDLVAECRRMEVPVYMKSACADYWAGPLLRQWPEAARGFAPAAFEEVTS